MLRRQLKWWARIVAWSGGGSLLTTVAFTGADVHTPWGQIVRVAGQGFVFSTCCIALASIVLPRVVPIARRRFSAPVAWTIVGVTLVASAMAACAGAVLLLAALGLVEPRRMWQLWLVSIRTATYFTLLFGIIASMMGDLRRRLNQTTGASARRSDEEERARHGDRSSAGVARSAGARTSSSTRSIRCRADAQRSAGRRADDEPSWRR